MSIRDWALITGCPSGFTEAICEVLEENDFGIYIFGKSEENLREFINKRTLKDASVTYKIIVKDALEEKSAQYTFNKIKENGFYPKIIIHHLGGTLGIRSSLSSESDWIKVLSLNCFFSFELNRLLIDYLRKKDFSRIINISSISSESLRGSGPYACSKALLNAYTKTLGRELAETNISVNSINLGAFETIKSNWANYRKNSPDIIEDFLRHHHASKRLGNPSEIKPIIKMLLDPQFSFGQGGIIEYDGATM